MDNKIIIDLVVLLILAAGVVFGAIRGLFKSLMMLVLVLAAVLAAGRLSAWAADPVTDWIYPSIEEKAESVINDKLLAAFGVPVQQMSPEEQEAAAALLSEQPDAPARSPLSEAAYDLVHGVVQVVLFIVLFIVLRLVLQLAVNVLDKVFDLPVLHTLNCVGGAVLGLIESALLLFLAVYLARLLRMTEIESLGEGTFLLSFFLDHTPYSLLSAIL